MNDRTKQFAVLAEVRRVWNEHAAAIKAAQPGARRPTVADVKRALLDVPRRVKTR